MGITIPKSTLMARLEDAVRLADSDVELPGEWLRRVEHISQCPSETYVAAFGVALLAKAADARVDALTIKASGGPTAYSMRGVATVLAGRARHFGYHLGVTGPEPLNNQPWFGNDRVDRIARIRADVVPYHEALVRYLRDLQALDGDEALLALAAFLRLRLAVGRAAARASAAIASTGNILQDVLQLADDFTRQNPEGGKRGQAVVAALLDCVHEEVQTGAINNPRAFDVQVSNDRVPVVAVEVKQKPVAADQVLHLAAEAAHAGIDKALYAALAADQRPLDVPELSQRAAREHGVLLAIGGGLPEVARLVLATSAISARDIAVALPNLVVARLVELRVSSAGQEHWQGYFV